MAAGACIYLWLMNRHFIAMTNSWAKTPVIGLLTLFVLVAPAAAGWHAEDPWRPLFPAAVFIAAGIGELRRQAIRRKHRGVEPTRCTHPGIKLARPFTTTDLAVTHYTVHVPTWHGPSVRIAHLSDFHANRKLPAAFYRGAFEQAADEQPDFLFVTGDFVTKLEHLDLLESILAASARVERRVAVLGNHDYWANPAQVARVVRSSGFDLLDNDHRTFDLGAPGKLVISGCDDPWGPGRWAKPPCTEEDLLLVLSHTPDNVYRLMRAGVHAVFSGHLHAGQFRIPGIGALALPSNYGRRYDHGHFRVEGTHLFVSAGIGANFPPVRVYCPPDLFIVEITGTQQR